MSLSTYHERKKEGLCPNCGGERLNPDFVLCHGCRGRIIASPNKPNTRIPFVDKRLFLGLHEWMIQQGKHYAPEYQI